MLRSGQRGKSETMPVPDRDASRWIRAIGITQHGQEIRNLPTPVDSRQNGEAILFSSLEDEARQAAMDCPKYLFS
jgi:hypothetical protein